MTEWQGIVSSVDSRVWHGVDLWSFKLEDQQRTFRHGREQPKFNVGDVISFNERNAQVDPSSVVVGQVHTTEIPAPVTQEEHIRPGVATVSEPAVPNAVAPSNRFQWQAARSDACNVIVAALHTDALPWAKNTAQGKKLDLLRGYIKELTQQFLEDEDAA